MPYKATLLIQVLLKTRSWTPILMVGLNYCFYKMMMVAKINIHQGIIQDPQEIWIQPKCSNQHNSLHHLKYPNINNYITITITKMTNSTWINNKCHSSFPNKVIKSKDNFQYKQLDSLMDLRIATLPQQINNSEMPNSYNQDIARITQHTWTKLKARCKWTHRALGSSCRQILLVG